MSTSRCLSNLGEAGGGWHTWMACRRKCPLRGRVPRCARRSLRWGRNCPYGMLPDPVILAAEIVEDLRYALEQFEGIEEDLEGE